MKVKTYIIGQGQFAVVVDAKLDDENRVRLYLSSVEDSTVELSSNMTQQPLTNGDIVSDHMYDLPATMSVNGAVSLSQGSFLLQRGNFTEFQALFERIKSEGILCTVSKIVTTTGNVRFTQRTNMALTRISWTERINSLNFAFSFTQALLADVITLTPSTSDKYLPSITEPQTLNFTDVFIDPVEIMQQVNSILVATGVITEALIEAVKSYLATAAIASVKSIVLQGLGALVGVKFGGGYGAIIGASVGMIVSMIIDVGSMLKLLSNFQQGFMSRLKEYQNIKSDTEKLQTVKDFVNFQSNLYELLLKLNEEFTVYKVGTNEEQECQAIFDDVSYLCLFYRNSMTGGYSMTITGQDGIDRAILADIASAPSSFDACTQSGKLFSLDQTGRELYFVNTNTEDRNDLSNCYLIATKLNPETFSQTLTDIIKLAFRR